MSNKWSFKKNKEKKYPSKNRNVIGDASITPPDYIKEDEEEWTEKMLKELFDKIEFNNNNKGKRK